MRYQYFYVDKSVMGAITKWRLWAKKERERESLPYSAPVSTVIKKTLDKLVLKAGNAARAVVENLKRGSQGQATQVSGSVPQDLPVLSFLLKSSQCRSALD